jgi:hypothetical protein
MSNYKLTSKETESVRLLTDELLASADSRLSLEENLSKSLSSRIQGIDSLETVKQIISGIKRFDDSLAANGKADNLKPWVSDKLSEALEGKDISEQHTTLLNVLTALSATDSAHTGELRLKFAQIKGAKVTADNVNELKALVAEYLDSNAVLYFDDSATISLLENLGADSGKELLNATWSEQSKPYLALSTYILKTTGELPSLPLEIGAEEIGVSTAAAVAREQVIRDGAAGRETWDMVLMALKAIATIAVALLAVYAIVNIALFVGSFVFVLVQGLVGLSVIGTLIALIAGTATVMSIVETAGILFEGAVDIVFEAINKIIEVYGKVRDWVKEKIFPEVIAFWARLKNAVLVGIDAYINVTVDEAEKANKTDETIETSETNEPTKTNQNVDNTNTPTFA